MTDSKKLLPLQAYEKSLLALLDEDPNQHQRRMKQRLKGERVTATKLPVADPILRRLQTDTIKVGPTITEAALAMEARIASEREEAYVVFIDHIACRNCGHTEMRQADHHIYLCLRATRKEDRLAKTRRYVPVKFLSNPGLPRRLESVFHAPFACQHCFKEIAPCPIPALAPSPTYSLVDFESPEDPPTSSDELSTYHPLDIPQPASTSPEAIETYRELQYSSFQEISHMNFVMSHSRNLLPARPAVAADCPSPIDSTPIARNMSLVPVGPLLTGLTPIPGLMTPSIGSVEGAAQGELR